MIFETRYTFGTRTDAALPEARKQVEAALRAEGFGILTEIDVAATLKARLGIDRDAYVILGACNPTLAHRALEADPSIGALLPCNVVVREVAGGTIVEAMDPDVALGVVELPEIVRVAAEARERLRRVIDAVNRSSSATPA
jgi:uncharacterized protein (DUF302 family)